MKMKKGDIVKITTGKDKGKTGKILKTLIKKDKILIEGLNLYKKHVRPKREGEKGQMVSVPRPIDISNTALICSSCNQATKIGHRFENKKKVRFCKKCKTTI
ncbi:50S ribosomal protein L24 [Candidatus Wolfebacteria bacterium]|nr:50S ribosomal protein L24 [Candidatus Wolfebacteria bacterium]